MTIPCMLVSHGGVTKSKKKLRLSVKKKVSNCPDEVRGICNQSSTKLREVGQIPRFAVTVPCMLVSHGEVTKSKKKLRLSVKKKVSSCTDEVRGMYNESSTKLREVGQIPRFAVTTILVLHGGVTKSKKKLRL